MNPQRPDRDADALDDAVVPARRETEAQPSSSIPRPDRAGGRDDDGWLDHLEPDDLRQLIATLPLIEQAKGVLMGYYRIDPNQAFALLQRWSSTRNTKLRHVCRAVVNAAQQHGGKPYSGLRDHFDSAG